MEVGSFLKEKRFRNNALARAFEGHLDINVKLPPEVVTTLQEDSGFVIKNIRKNIYNISWAKALKNMEANEDISNFIYGESKKFPDDNLESLSQKLCIVALRYFHKSDKR